MRSDLNKQLCERERHRSYDRYGNYRHLRKFNRTGDEELSGLPTREGMKHRYVNGWNTKDLNENLNPLWGAVRKNVGRRWDAFYSDICKVFDKRSVVNQHILDHLFQEVERNVFVGEDGELYVRREYGRGREELLREASTEYYVDPRDGILKRNKHYKTYSAAERDRAAKKRREEAKVFRQLDENTVLRNVDGVWYEYEMKPYPLGHYKITKPLNVDVFKVYGREKDWESMSEAERDKYGVKTYVGESAYDVFTKTFVRIDEWIARRLQHENQRRKSGKKTIVTQYAERKYHASRKTASKKTLRDAGITE